MNLMKNDVVACRYLILGGALIQIKVFLGDRGIGIINSNLNGCLCSEIGRACMETGCANIGSLNICIYFYTFTDKW